LLFDDDSMFSSRLDGVEEANNIGVRRVKLMPRSEWLEPEEEEVTDDVLVVVVQPIKTSHNIADSKFLLGVFK